MKKIFIVIALFFIANAPALADETDYSGFGDMTRNYSTMDNAYVGQKKITDEEFQKTLDAVKAKQNKRKRINQPFKGQDSNEVNSGTYLDETVKNITVLTLPLELINNDGGDIPIGHYKIVGNKVKGKVYLDFYQSSTLVAHVSATETNDDFNEPNMNFVKLIPYNSQKVKVIYGSIDFNAYTFIKIKNEISD